MWTHFIERVVDTGGIIGITAVVLAFVAIYLFRQYQTTASEHRKALASQNAKCIECMTQHDAQSLEIRDSCHKMVREFYDTHREDMQNGRLENLNVMNRVISSNEAVADSVNRVNTTLANISGRLEGR